MCAKNTSPKEWHNPISITCPHREGTTTYVESDDVIIDLTSEKDQYLILCWSCAALVRDHMLKGFLHVLMKDYLEEQLKNLKQKAGYRF